MNMNIRLKTIVTSILVLSLWSCEDVIQVDVPSEDPRLIVDAIVRVDVEQPVTLVRVKVSETNSFFGTVPPANLQQITMSNLDNPGGDGQVLNEEVPGSGIYSEFFPTDELIADTWFLQIDFEDKFFVATSNFVPTVPINSLTQGTETLFDEDDIEVIVNFTDAPDREDFYLFDFDLDNFLVSEDTFFEGQEFEFSYFYDDDIEPNTELEISILGVDESFYNYMDQLIIQSGDDFGPFETPALTVRGNIINATDIDNDNNFNNLNSANNFALGYFAIVQEYKSTITITEN